MKEIRGNGWESVLRGKYAIVFGFPWYQKMPGIFSVQNISELKEYIITLEKENTILKERLKQYETSTS